MGIRGLGAAVRPYGVVSSLNGDAVVIDGPALVHQILDGCMRQRLPSNCFICHPSYSTLGRMVIGWLDELRAHGITVRRIYFDGYLPPSKWRVRQERLLRQSQTVKDLLASHPRGSSKLPDDTFDAVHPEIALTQNAGQSSRFSWLPKPPFLVPAVIEILKSCDTWGPLVEVVSGEADMFCAEDIRQHGGVLLTSDSDLLITDLGPHGTVSFFSDVVAADRSNKCKGLVACKFSLHAINDKLGLNKVGGLSRVAFEHVKCRTSFHDAVKRTKHYSHHSIESPDFQAFMEEYSMKEYLPKSHPVQGILSRLDPRISEIIIQALLVDGNRIVTDAGSAHDSRGPESLAMFLPVMVEVSLPIPRFLVSIHVIGVGRGLGGLALSVLGRIVSSLHNTIYVRKLAYSIIQKFAVHNLPAVIEWRSLEASNSLMGRQVNVSGLEETLTQCRQLEDTFGQLTERIPSTDMQWLSFAIYQDIMWSASEQRLPLSATLIHEMKRESNHIDHHSWDTIHFAAQLQASLYSLRMEKQVLDVAAELCTTIPPPMRELRKRLGALPAIGEWPTAANISQMLATADEANVLSTVTDMLGISAIDIPDHASNTNQGKKRKNGNGPLKSQRGSKRPGSVNPFAILSHESLNS
ncbi:hypothetical protein NUW58_g4766 [Xylaria curta]|uniref:Uncharacterized protein n=1 Tax=Xylaria curta TaxID=42375 RepID=A0ACC1P5G1_9PEZI|nr:hypothetical protein NUW58_g4766 [Xylaria curta]